jgi:hypothetical protein
MTRFRSTISILFLLPVLFACATVTGPVDVACDDPTSATCYPELAAIVGTWSLQSWNGKPVPARYSTYLGPCSIDDCSLDPDSVEVMAGGSIVLTSDQTYTRVTDWRIEHMDGTTQRSFTRTEQGTYTGSVASGSVVLNLYGGVRMRVAVSGNAMSAKIAVDQPNGEPIVLGDVWLYQR